MKKRLILFLGAILLAFTLVSCGKTEAPAEETTETEKEEEQITTEPIQEETPLYSEKDYAFVQKFAPPEGDDYRQIVKDYFIKMSEIEWTPAETFEVGWKGEARFNVGLKYEAGTLYHGPVYSDTIGGLGLFEKCLTDGKFTSLTSTTYYEEIVGNHCSSSMDMAYQNLYNFTHITHFMPLGDKRELVDFPIELKTPENKGWISEDLFKLNGREKIFEAYAAMKTGDMLYRKVNGSGHVRMVDSVHIEKLAAGNINYRKSYILTMEQTNVFESKENKNFVKENGYDTTWFIDHKYTFEDLFAKSFMPLTQTIFESGEKLEDAYIVYDGNVGKENILDSISGSVKSNFPINYVYMAVKDTNGSVVSKKLVNNLNPKLSEEYSVSLGDYHDTLINNLPSGTYTFSLSAGIARGDCEITTFEFTK